MSTNNPTVVKRVLQDTIHYHLDNYSLNNALFFAESLAAFDSRSSQSRLLLGLCHFRLDDYQSALEALKPSPPKTPELGCTWIYAQCCFALKKYKDGATALERSKSLWPQTTRIGRGRPSARGVNPDRAALLCLLGKLYRQLDDKDKAIRHFESALKGNPFMWDAFTNLCDMGVTVSVPSVFKVTDSLVQSFDSTRENSHSSTTSDTASSSTRKSSVRASSKAKDVSGNADATQQPLAPVVRTTGRSVAESDEGKAAVPAMAAPRLEAVELCPSLPHPADSRPLRDSQPDLFRNSVRRARKQVTELAATGVLPRMTVRMGSKRNPKKEARVKGEGKQRAQDIFMEPSLSATPTKGRKRLRSEDQPLVRVPGIEEPGAPLNRTPAFTSLESPTSQVPGVHREPPNATNTCPPRATKKARRLLPKTITANQKEPGEGNRQRSESSGADAAKSGMPTQENWIAKPLPLMEKRPDTSKGVEISLKWTLNLLKMLGTGYYALSRFQCEKALKAYHQLPHDQGQTPWVLGQMGRALFEHGDYSLAERAFRALRSIAPTRHRDMEIYSTVLWHLERQAELSFLAHELLDLSWHSPEA
ncbi:tetratricopeptide repeat protein [Candidatus Bathyarchaeota archaeon]|nr:tetratricopeptide repeat protein [Candidatus Bathyarchaeota archaeon]